MTQKVICITGGANGLGREIAASFSGKEKVIILDINPAVTKLVAQTLECDYQICDVSDFGSLQDSIEKIIDKYDKIDCFINNAGIYIDGPIEDNDPQLIKKVIEVNTLGPILAANLLVPIFKKQKHGIIININSTASLHPKALNSVYHASKWGLGGFSQSLQLELSESNIKVIDICPGIMDTNFTKGTDDYDPSHSLNPEAVTKTIDFVLSLDKNVTIPQLTIKHI